MNILFGLSPSYNVFLNGPLVIPQWFNYNQIKLCMLISHMPKRVVAHNHNWICLGISMRLHSILGQTMTKQVLPAE